MSASNNPPAAAAPPRRTAGHSKHGSDDLTRANVESMRRLESAMLDKRSKADHMAAFIARFCGSMMFVWLHVLAFFCWLGFNLLPGLPHFDPYPFTFLTLVVSLEAIFLSSFILISQNYELRISDRRNQLDLQINLLTEQENTKTLQMLQRIAVKLGIDDPNDTELHMLQETIHPERLISQIEQAQRDDPIDTSSLSRPRQAKPA